MCIEALIGVKQTIYSLILVRQYLAISRTDATCRGRLTVIQLSYLVHRRISISTDYWTYNALGIHTNDTDRLAKRPLKGRISSNGAAFRGAMGNARRAVLRPQTENASTDSQRGDRVDGPTGQRV